MYNIGLCSYARYTNIYCTYKAFSKYLQYLFLKSGDHFDLVIFKSSSQAEKVWSPLLYNITLPPDIKAQSYIIVTGSCRPTRPFPRDKSQQNRCFSNTYYTTTTKAGIKLLRTWLCYLPTLDCAYCEKCWLFAD